MHLTVNLIEERLTILRTFGMTVVVLDFLNDSIYFANVFVQSLVGLSVAVSHSHFLDFANLNSVAKMHSQFQILVRAHLFAIVLDF